MPLFIATFSAHAFSAQEDVFELLAPSTSRLEIRQIIIGQYSDFGDAQSEILSVQLLRGHTVAGSGGAAATPVNLEPWSRAADSTVNVNNTTIASGGSPATIWSDTMNVAAGWFFGRRAEDFPLQLAQARESIKIEASQRFVVRLSAPADALTLNGTILFEELGKI